MSDDRQARAINTVQTGRSVKISGIRYLRCVSRWTRDRLVLLAAVATLGVTALTVPAFASPAEAGVSPQSVGCWNGARKFIHTESNGNQHHIVEFDVNVSVVDSKWYVAQKPWGYPFSASVWPGYYNRTHKWIAYQWPYNWPDPYAASSWVLCYS